MVKIKNDIAVKFINDRIKELTKSIKYNEREVDTHESFITEFNAKLIKAKLERDALKDCLE